MISQDGNQLRSPFQRQSRLLKLVLELLLDLIKSIFGTENDSKVMKDTKHCVWGVGGGG